MRIDAELFLEPDKVELLHDFEEECMDDLARRKHFEKVNSKRELIQNTHERTEALVMKIRDITSRDHLTRQCVREMEQRLLNMESQQAELLSVLRAALSGQRPPPPRTLDIPISLSSTSITLTTPTSTGVFSNMSNIH